MGPLGPAERYLKNRLGGYGLLINQIFADYQDGIFHGNFFSWMFFGLLFLNVGGCQNILVQK